MKIQTVTVIGANGAMGRNLSAIFASFGDAKVYMVCRSQEKAERAKQQAILSVKADAIANNLFPCDDTHIGNCIAESDLVFDSIVEDINEKMKYNSIITKYARPDAIICTGTSGLSVNMLASSLQPHHQARYFGLHLFNPPYHMPLCELIVPDTADPEICRQLKEYAINVLQRTVVEVKDAPAFLGNRIGFQLMNEALQAAETWKDSGGIDYIDAILGQYTGRSMAPLNTADFVGLDVHKAIVDNIYKNTNDCAHETFALPDYVNELIQQNRLGKKSGAGLYKVVKEENEILRREVYDISNREYRNINQYVFPFKNEMIRWFHVGNYEKAMKVLIDSKCAEARICMHFLLKYVAYSVFCAKELAESVHAADDVMAAGFNWAPPLSIIDAFGGSKAVTSLALERLDDAFCSKIKLKQILCDLPKSQYDFRKYFKAKQ